MKLEVGKKYIYKSHEYFLIGLIEGLDSSIINYKTLKVISGDLELLRFKGTMSVEASRFYIPYQNLHQLLWGLE